MTCLYTLNTDRRDISREEYKVLYRYLRVASSKAEEHISRSIEDMLLFGTGALFVPNNGEPRHVPLKDIMTLDHQ